MPPVRACLLLALALTVAGCDSGGTLGSAPGALLTVDVVNDVGAPAVGVDVYATFGSLQPGAFRSASSSRTLEVATPFPNPATVQSTVRWFTSEPGAARVRVYDVEGAEQADLLDGDLAVGTHQVVVDVSDWPSGLYTVVVEVGDQTVERPLLVTDSGAPGEVGLAIALGQTDIRGRLVVTDSTRFPGLYGGGGLYTATDDTGAELGRFGIGTGFEVVAEGDQGETASGYVSLVRGGSEVSLRFES